jgi:uncharacterized protein (TIGR03067 family)
MKRFLFGLLMAAAVGGAVLADDKAKKGAVKDDDKTTAEAKKLQGTWEIEALEIMGKKIDAPKGKGGSIVFSKDMKVTMKDPGKEDKPGTYKIDASKDPKHLDLIELKDGKEGKVTQLIYEVEGDKLKMGFSAEGPKGKRPTSFKGDKVAIMHLKRQ